MVESRLFGGRPLFLGVSAPLAGAVLAFLVAVVVTVVLSFPALDTRLGRVVAAVSATGLRALFGEGCCSFALVSATRFLGGIFEQ